MQKNKKVLWIIVVIVVILVVGFGAYYLGKNSNISGSQLTSSVIGASTHNSTTTLTTTPIIPPAPKIGDAPFNEDEGNDTFYSNEPNVHVGCYSYDPNWGEHDPNDGNCGIRYPCTVYDSKGHFLGSGCVTSFSQQNVIGCYIGTSTICYPSGTVLGSGLSLGLNSTGISVVTLQAFLYKKGYSKTTPTGYFDTKTQVAVKAFQTANKLTSDGIVGTNTATLINKLLLNTTTTNTTSGSATKSIK